MVHVDWEDLPSNFDQGPWSVVGEHDAAIVHWDHGVMEAFAPALSACGRAALVLHQAPHALARWFGPEILPATRISLDRALAELRVELHAGILHGLAGGEDTELRKAIEQTDFFLVEIRRGIIIGDLGAVREAQQRTVHQLHRTDAGAAAG